MKRTSSFIVAIIVIVFTISSCGFKKITYDYHSELGDSLIVEISMAGGLDGSEWPCYNIYDGNGDKIGNVTYGDRDADCFPDDPLSKIEPVGKYGETSFYRFFNMIFFYQKGVRMGVLPENPSLDEYRTEVEIYYTDPNMFKSPVSDLMKSGNFEFIYTYGIILVYENDPTMKELLIRYANSDFTEEEIKNNEGSFVSETDMTSWAIDILEIYYSD